MSDCEHDWQDAVWGKICAKCQAWWPFGDVIIEQDEEPLEVIIGDMFKREEATNDRGTDSSDSANLP